MHNITSSDSLIVQISGDGTPFYCSATYVLSFHFHFLITSVCQKLLCYMIIINLILS